MATRTQAVAGNVPGAFFVDTTCIDCDTCRQLAPATFGDNGEMSFVQFQPQRSEQRAAAYRALVACPTGSIGADDKSGVAAAVDEFPLPLAEGVSYCGFNSRKSFGGNSYFVEHPNGNWLVDSPRYVEHLARHFARRGGIRYIFLTHRDDVADAGKFAARFHSTRIIHRLELAAQPGAERVLDGTAPVELAPDFLAIPTPGHTRGHCVLLHKTFLFTGDHLWWSRSRNRLTASRDVCWYSWRDQVESVKALKSYDFEWILPGHGERANFPREQMASEFAKLIDAIS